MFFTNIIEFLANKNNNLKFKLKEAGYTITTEEFLRKTIKASLMQTIAIVFFIFIMIVKTTDQKTQILVTSVTFLTVFPLFYKAYQYQPDIKIKKIRREIDKEIVFAGRYMIVELESGISIYDAMKNTIKSYPNVGKYFRMVVDKVDMGVTVKKALNQVIEITPSDNFRRILWQILNSMKTGTNIAHSINSVVEMIVKEQMISLNEYSKKLNPLAMFYMIMAVIFPSLGVTFAIIFSSFLGFKMDLSMMLIFSAFIGGIQYFFYNLIKDQRPAISV
ncbi:MAG: hypothetical protein GWP09_02245 [Nitrospiraceae bacterium]|nr:hypothetical protein [Nitrospiraceae bacterium]